MKHKIFTYHCGFLSPLLLAIILLVLPQLAKATNATGQNGQLSVLAVEWTPTNRIL